MFHFYSQVQVWVVGDEVLLDQTNARLLGVAGPGENEGKDLFQRLPVTAGLQIKSEPIRVIQKINLLFWPPFSHLQPFSQQASPFQA